MIYRLTIVTRGLLEYSASHMITKTEGDGLVSWLGFRRKGGVHTDVFVSQLVGETHTLGLVLYRLAVDDGVLELLENGAVDGVTL